MNTGETVEIKGLCLLEDAVNGVRVVVQLANGVCKEVFATKTDNSGLNRFVLPAGIMLAPEYNG